MFLKLKAYTPNYTVTTKSYPKMEKSLRKGFRKMRRKSTDLLSSVKHLLFVEGESLESGDAISSQEDLEGPAVMLATAHEVFPEPSFM